MADQNPMGSGRAVALDLPASHLAILRSTLSDALEGVLEDLTSPGKMPQPTKARREAEAYDRLLVGLGRGEVIVPDQAAREAVAILATAADEANNYVEVVAEHDALAGLLARLTPRAVPEP